MIILKYKNEYAYLKKRSVWLIRKLRGYFMPDAAEKKYKNRQIMHIN